VQSDNSHLTLREYVRIFRRHRLAIAALTLLGAAAALGLALSTQATYTAQASVQVQDLSQDFAAVGAAVPQAQTPQQLASAAAETTTTAAVAARVKQQLGSPRTVSALENSITATVDTSSNFVIVAATDRTARGAAALANAFAQQSVAVSNENARARFSAEAQTLATQISGLAHAAGNSESIFEMQTERAHFLSLASFAQAATVVQPATVPSAPTSPKPAFDAVLGGVIGFILAVLIAFGRVAIDQRVTDGDTVEQLLGYQVIGDLRADALGRAPTRDDGLGPLSPADVESVRIIRRNLDYLTAESPVRTVAVTSALPQEGKSTVAAALAFSAATIGRRTLLVEADMRRPVLAERLGLEREPGLVDLLAGKASLEEVVQVVQIAHPAGSSNGSGPAPPQDSGLVCIVAGSPTGATDELFSSKAFRTMVSDAAAAYDLVVLDCAPLLPVADALEVVSVVDGIVLCVRAHQTTRDQAVAAKTAIRRTPGRPTGIVVTGLSAADDYGSYAYSYAYRSPSE
jgi:capsular exopolysaccharide synthesis family protein